MTWLTAAPRVAAIIPMLGSAERGDVLAAAAGIDRTLKSHSCDWFDLQRNIRGAGQGATYRKAPKPPGLPPKWSTMPNGERKKWLCLLDSIADELSQFERGFLDKLAEFVRRPYPLRLSPKQITLLDIMIAGAWRRGLNP